MLILINSVVVVQQYEVVTEILDIGAQDLWL